MSSTTYLYTHSYKGNSEINFCVDDNTALTVTIDTERLHLQSVDSSDKTRDSYVALYGDQEVAEHFGITKTKTRDEVVSQVDYFVKRWQANNPYGSFSIYVKDTDEFAGNVMMGFGDDPKPGQIELMGGLSTKPNWDKQYGVEAVAAIVKEYIPATIKEGYMIDGKALDRIVAPVRPDNILSVQILKSFGMQFETEEQRLGVKYHLYSMKV